MPSVHPVVLVLVGDSDEFVEQAEAFAAEVDLPQGHFVELRRASDMLGLGFRDGSVSQLAIFAHGTPTCVGKPGRWGVETREARAARREYLTPLEFADAWAPKLVPDALVSLCACMCSRDPRWYRVQRWGKDWSPWSAKSYQDGGVKSIAGVLARSLYLYGTRVRVRGHCASGHCTHQALLREHTQADGDGIGRALYLHVTGDSEPTWARMRRWQDVVKGDLSERYLLGLETDDGLTATIRGRLGAC